MSESYYKIILSNITKKGVSSENNIVFNKGKGNYVDRMFGVPKSATQMRVDRIKTEVLENKNWEEGRKKKRYEESTEAISSMAKDVNEAAGICSEINDNLKKTREKILNA